MNESILIKRPRIVHGEDKARLVSDIVFPDGTYPLWVEVEDKWAEYLTYERTDGFLLALLPIAMREHLDIVCEAPIEQHLLYQLQDYLIPALVKGDPTLYALKITADADTTTLPNAGAVGTGISCGVDSLHVIKRNQECCAPDLKITHLVMANVGAFVDLKKDNSQFSYQSENAEKFARRYGYKLIKINSNFKRHEYHGKQRHLFTHVYSNSMAVFSLQKLWRAYFYASTYDFTKFNLIGNSTEDAAYYDLLYWAMVSVPNLRFHNEGGSITRFDKTAELVDFAPAHEFLNVCVDESGNNCGWCFKCQRTLLTLDALGALDKFDKVFDIDDYKRNRNRHLLWLVRQRFLKGGDHMINEAYEILRPQVPVKTFLLGVASARLSNRFKEGGALHRMMLCVREFVAPKKK